MASYLDDDDDFGDDDSGPFTSGRPPRQPHSVRKGIRNALAELRRAQGGGGKGTAAGRAKERQMAQGALKTGMRPWAKRVSRSDPRDHKEYCRACKRHTHRDADGDCVAGHRKVQGKLHRVAPQPSRQRGWN